MQEHDEYEDPREPFFAALRARSRLDFQNLWEAYQAGEELDSEAKQLALAMEQHPEFYSLWDVAASLGDEDWEIADMNPFLHATIHAVVETQLQQGDPPEAAELLTALQEAGADRHAAIHVVGAVLAQQIWHVLKEEQPFDPAWYRARLRYMAQLAQGVAPDRRPRGSEPCPCGSGRPSRQCCGHRWPPIPIIDASKDPQAPPEARRRRPGSIMVLGAGRFAPPSVVNHLPQDHPIVFLENAAVVAESLAKAGKFAAAWDTHQRIIAAAQGDHHLLRSALQEALLFCLDTPGYEEQGLELVERILPLAEAPVEAALYRLDAAEFLFRLGQESKAKALYQKERAQQPTWPELPFRWALAMERAGRYKEAMAAYEAVLKLPPQLSAENPRIREQARQSLRYLRQLHQRKD